LFVTETAPVSYEWRGAAEELELDWLHAEAFDHPPVPAEWQRQLEDHSLGWVCARQDEELVGFVNVVWDGGRHAFIIDTAVLPAGQRQGIGTQLVRVAAEHAKHAGCSWLHVDFERDLAGFYLEACGFYPIEAGLLDLTTLDAGESAEEGEEAVVAEKAYEVDTADEADEADEAEHVEQAEAELADDYSEDEFEITIHE
jgi:GNAT superfamily N-acetyltransferase